MFKIDGPNTVNGMPARTALGAFPGWFNQTPGAGAGTVVTGEFLNMWQAEFLAVLGAAGIAPDKAADNQILLAIQAIASSLSGWSTGDMKLTFKTVADAGWVMMNDGSIGNAASAATTRANADTAALFALLWANVADADAPVSGGRGGSAAADFAANKTLTLSKMLGRALGVAGAGAGLTARALGHAVGAETHNHGGFVAASALVQVAGDVGVATSHPDHNHAISTDTTLQPTVFLNAMIKL